MACEPPDTRRVARPPPRSAGAQTGDLGAGAVHQDEVVAVQPGPGGLHEPAAHRNVVAADEGADALDGQQQAVRAGDPAAALAVAAVASVPRPVMLQLDEHAGAAPVRRPP